MPIFKDKEYDIKISFLKKRFPSFCGGRILHRWWIDYYDGVEREDGVPPKVIKKFKEWLKQEHGYDEYGMEERCYHYIQAVDNTTLHSLCRKCKFTKIDTIINPNTGNKVHQYRVWLHDKNY